MTVDLDSGTGLFDRLGRMGYLLDIINGRFGGSSSDDFPVELNDIAEEFDGETNNDIRKAVDNLLTAFQTFQGTPATFRTALQTAAQNVLIEMVHADNPLPSKTVANALTELIRQMETAATPETVDASEPTIASLVDGPRFGNITAATQANPVVVTSANHGLANEDVVTIRGVTGMTEINDRQFTVSGVTTNTFELNGEDGSGHTVYSANGQWFANYGNANMVTSLINGQGKTLENAFAEDIKLKISDTSTAGNESGSMAGEAAATGLLYHDWPLGSGGTATITVQNPASDGHLTNGDMEDFTTNAPDNWVLTVGAAGTDFLEETTNVYRGNSSLEIVGDSSTLQELRQSLTLSGLASRTPYPVCCWVKVDVVPASGTLIIDLYDADNDVVISDDAGTACSLSIDLTAATTTFQPYSAAFRLPEALPTNVTARIRLSAALSTGSSVFIDQVLIGDAMTQVYNGGPYVSLVRGGVDVALDDVYIATVTNAREGAFQTLFQRFFNQSLLLPSATGAGETIDDALIG